MLKGGVLIISHTLKLKFEYESIVYLISTAQTGHILGNFFARDFF